MAQTHVRIFDVFLNRLGFGNPAFAPVKSSTKTVTALPKMPAGLGMKTSPAPVLTYGTGLEPASIYGAVPISEKRIREVQAEAAAESRRHEVEISTPIKTFSGEGSSFGSTHGGLGLTSPGISQSVRDWERRTQQQFEVLKPPPITSTSGIKTFKN